MVCMGLVEGGAMLLTYLFSNGVSSCELVLLPEAEGKRSVVCLAGPVDRENIA